MTQFLDKIGLNYFWQKIKQTFPTRNEILDSEEAVSAALNDLNTRIPENISEFITGSDLKTINGQQITGSGDININFYGESSTPAATVQKEISIPSITTLNVGQFIIVKPTITSTVANSTLKLNNFDAYPMRYNSSAITTSTDSVVWNANYPSIFVFDGSYWVFAGHGLDSNTTYSGMTQAEATAGTATANRVISAKVLNDTIDGKLPLVTTTSNGLMSSLDKVKLDDIEVDYSKQYLTFVALEDGTFSFSGSGISYSVDGGATWTELASNTASPTVTAGNKIMWKASLTPTSSAGIGTFSSTAQFDVEGNLMSLLFGDNFKGQTDLTGKSYAFHYIFQNNTNVVNAKNLSLPATTLATACYQNMFNGCTSLTTAPELPATTLEGYCYNGMFYKCTSLTTAPALPATTLANYCYQFMFSGCTSLTKAPALPATTLANYCYNGMFKDCTSLNYIKAMFLTTLNSTYNWVEDVASTGIFVKNGDATWDVTIGVDGVPKGWTVCTESEWEYAHIYDINKVSKNVTDINKKLTIKISSHSVKTNEIIGLSRIYKILIPIDPVENAYLDNTVISETEIVPYINTLTGENYLILKLGSVISSDYVITEAHIIGTGIYSTPDIRYVDSNMYIYPKLPLGITKDNLQNLIVSYYNNFGKIAYRIWFDDYPYEDSGYASLDEWAQNESDATDWNSYVTTMLNDDEYDGANPFTYTGETFEWNGSEYYLWESDYNDEISFQYILTDTISYSELYGHSLEANPQNHWCPYVAVLTSDKEVYRTAQDGADDILVKVEPVTE